MASQSFRIGANSVEQTNQEEARKRHLKTLRKRTRFRTKAAADEALEVNGNNNLSAQQGGQSSGISFPAPHQSFARNNIPLPALPPPHYHVDHTMPGNPFSRRYSTASYQPMFVPHVHVPFCYFPNSNTAVFRGLTVGADQVHPANAVPNWQQHADKDDDDVFVSSENVANPIPFPTHVPVALPCSPATIQQIQSRKRAHSAGDMIGLCLPSTPQFSYPRHANNPVEPSNNSSNPKPAQNTSMPSQHVSKQLSACPVPPRKRFIVEVASNDQGSTSSTVAVPAHSHMMSNTNHTSGKTLQSKHCSNDPTTSRISDNSRLSIEVRHENKSLGKQSQLHHPPNQNAAAGTEARTNAKLLQPHNSDVSTPKPSKPTSVLKSSLSSRSLPIKKKVVWNDLAQKKKLIKKTADPLCVPIEPLDESLKKLDIASIKANPSTYTAKNKIGPYFIGPRLGCCPVKSISQYLVRKCDSNKYYMAKILRMDEEEVKSGKMLLHTEHSLLSSLSSHNGVIRQHGMFKDCSYDDGSSKISPRIGLILDCLTPHEYNAATQNYFNLQQYVIQMKRLSEQEAIRIFHTIVLIIESLHKSNIVHRDLKLGNMVYNKRTRQITLTNFCLGCHLTSERDLLTDQRGSPAYISPDVLSDKPYAGKPSDMWSLGVVLFTMLYGQFPFYDQEPKKLFAKIKTADYTIPSTGQVSVNTNNLIRGLLTLDPAKRLTALDALVALETCAAALHLLRVPSTPSQVVPDIDDVKVVKAKKIEGDTEAELTRAFRLKLVSDDESDDSQTNFSKGVQKCKRRILDKLALARQNSPINDFYRVQVRHLGSQL